MQIFKQLGWFFAQEKKRYLVGIAALFAVALLQVIPPKVIGIVIDEIHQKEMNFSVVLRWGALLIATALLQYAFRYIWRRRIWGGAAKLEKILRQRLFHHFMKMDTIFYQKHRTGDLMAHATNDLTAIQNVAGAGILTFADSLLTGGTTLVAMIFAVNWRLTLLALLPLPLLALFSKLLGAKLHDAFSNAQAAFSMINDKTQESITGIKVIKAFGQEKEDIADFEQKIEQTIKKNQKVNFLDALFDPVITVVIGLAYVLTIIYGGRLVINQTITIGQLVTFISYIGMLVWPMFAIGRLFNVLERGSASYERVHFLLGEKSERFQPQEAVRDLVPGKMEYHVKEFTYPAEDGSAFQLQAVDFSLAPGETLGIVGRTGSDKTTILKLLMREYDQYEGAIDYAGHDIRDYTLDSYFSHVGYVPQDYFLFSMSVADNIRFSNPQLSFEKVKEAATIADVAEDIERFPEQYETMVGERGVSLSGGQKQRLSIARALAVHPDLLILDDALSAVDAETEEEILQNLKALHQNQAMIICAHRLSSVMHAKEILVMEQGRVAERGTHAELLAKNGWYAQMFRKQQLERKLGEELDDGKE